MREQIAIMNCARLKKRLEEDELIKRQAGDSFEKHKSNPLFLSGVVLYWAEGTRFNKKNRKYQLAFTNSDPNLVSFYCKFLREYFRNIENKDLRVGLFLYPDLDNNQVASYWSDFLDIPLNQFIKPQILRGGSDINRRLKFGVCCVYINSKEACLTMQTWIGAVCGMTRR